MKLHNTPTRKIEDFVPIDKNKVRIYSCGPTVYNHAHIGNLSSYIYADLLRRVLAAGDLTVQHVMNFTDVEDKIIRTSQERYPDMSPEEALHKLTREYGQLFLDDMEAIGNDTAAMKFVWATETIEGMRALITDLYNDGFAYIADGGVYFSIEKYKASGKKYGQLLELNSENTSSARIDNDEYDKESVHDFALWKGMRPGEPAWEFALDGQDLTGRPGWHIECSVMSVNNLGQPFDIHTGGVDLIFPHHENEIAQSTAGKGDIYATYFVHNEHLLVDGKKMSKSLGNFFTLQDIRERGYDPLAFRLMVLQSHYRKQSNFTWENLEAAQNRLQNWRQNSDMRWQVIQLPDFIGLDNLPETPEAFEELEKNHPYTLKSTKLVDQFTSALENDLDTPAALAAIDGLMGLVEKEGMTSFLHLHFTKLLQLMNQALGIDLFSEDISDEQKSLLADRAQARTDKDWAQSDKLRDQLKEQGIGVRDSAHTQIWFRA